jgi:hypothetical protein
VVRHDRTRDRDFVAKAAALLIEHDFGLVGTVLTPPDARRGVEVQLRGGGLGVPLGRWVKKGEVFALLPRAAEGAVEDPVPWALLQVEKPPADDARDGVCVCRLFHRYELSRVAGLRCIKLGTAKGVPLRLRLMREQDDRTLAPLDTRLSLQIRPHGFQGEETTTVLAHTDPTGGVDTSQLEKKCLFDHVAFVSVYSTPDKPLAQVPVALVGDRLVVVPVSASDSGSLFGLRLQAWRRGVSESLRVQIALFKKIEENAAKPDQRAQTLKLARDCARRSQDDRVRLAAEREALLAEAEQRPGKQKPDLAQEDRRLKDLQEGEAELQRFIARQEEIERKENDPKRRVWLEQVERARLLEKDAEVGKAIAIYEKVLQEGYDNAELKAYLEKLQKLWKPANDEHRAARAFIYDVWPTLDKAGLKKHLDDARKALAVCSQFNDVFAARKLFKATEAHAIQLTKEFAELKPEIHLDDEAPARLIRELEPGLTKLAAEVKAFLDRAGPADG